MAPKELEIFETREKAIMNYNSGMELAERRGIGKWNKEKKRNKK